MKLFAVLPIFNLVVFGQEGSGQSPLPMARRGKALANKDVGGSFNLGRREPVNLYLVSNFLKKVHIFSA
jgi:hypothetical protein